ncbi:CinA family nicotinamide mononucleotide deamidase-related protein [Polluticoccus soli]|uniref:CinA family nicotinamide mononucleotide deamidase-related protein n=1 Tax=Polluticoccus soli TaxID=3034150 RepID=UPI0023E28947|nr:CinA family nicotinamide mononucleotide deamidase-related protein [Flavipsychrobacter sp. JY13-12]
MANVQVSIITIGDELLIGQTVDTNSVWMAQRLNDLGIEVKRRVSVGDIAADIRTALDAEIAVSDVVLITGGLGPTVDDITKPLLCQYFGGNMIVNEEVLQHVKKIFEVRKKPFLERNLKQAEVPDSCTVLFNKLGTAPGMLFERSEKAIIAMPGVPFEMMGIMEDEVIPYLQQNFISDALLHRSILTAGEGESFIAEKIIDIETALPSHVKLAYLPSAGVVRLRLTGRGADKQRLVKELEMYQDQIANRVEEIVVSLHDLPLEHILGRTLLENRKTIGLAESCTGGYIAHHITQVMGSANYFQGSIVCYQNEIKEKLLGVKKETLEEHGAVSEHTAIEMAVGARKKLKADYGLGVTGLLSAGGEDDRVPVGTVWIAVADEQRTVAKQFRFHYDRPRNKDMATQVGMLMAWKFLQKKI